MVVEAEEEEEVVDPTLRPLQYFKDELVRSCIAACWLEDVEIEKVTLITRVKNNPASYSVNIDGNPVNLSRIDEWKLCRGSKIGIDIETPFELAISPAQLGNLEDLMIVVKYSF